MVQRVEATFKDGVLRPLTELSLRNDQRVWIIVETAETLTEEQRRGAMERFIQRTEEMNFRHGGTYPTRDELHERR